VSVYVHDCCEQGNGTSFVPLAGRLLKSGLLSASMKPTPPLSAICPGAAPTVVQASVTLSVEVWSVQFWIVGSEVFVVTVKDCTAGVAVGVGVGVGVERVGVGVGVGPAERLGEGVGVGCGWLFGGSSMTMRTMSAMTSSAAKPMSTQNSALRRGSQLR